MPSCDPAALLRMAQQLTNCAQDSDWERMAQLDVQLSCCVHAAARPLTDPALRHAWQQVAQAHEQARRACAQARDCAAQQLRDVHVTQEAHKAYAWQEMLA